MRILTVDNKPYSMNNIPSQIEASEDIRYCVLDYCNPKNVDYIFIPLLFLDTFNVPSANLRIGPYMIQVPMDWHIVIADKNGGDLEVIELKHLNGRDFQAFAINPVSGFMPEFYDISIMDLFPDMTWYFPKMKYGHLLAVPLSNKPGSPCIFLVKDAGKIPEVLDITQMV